MNVINQNKARAQQWKTLISQEFENGLKKEQKVKLRQWAKYIERVVPAKSPNYHQLIRILASMNQNNKIFPPFDKAPNDKDHTWIENLGLKLKNLGLTTEAAEDEMEMMSVDELNLIQKVVDPKGAKIIASQQESLKKSVPGKTKTTKVQLTRTKVIPGSKSQTDIKKTTTKTITATTKSAGTAGTSALDIPLINSGTPTQRAAAAKKLESKLSQDIVDFFGGNDDVRKYCEKWMCHFQTLLKTDQRRFDSLRVLQVMIRARCFAHPFNLSIKKRYNKRELIEILEKLDLPAVMSQEIRAAYMTIHNIELNFEDELSFDKDIDRAMNAYLIKRFDLWPRVQDTMKRIQKLVSEGKPFMPTEWENFLTSTKGTAALMGAKVKLLQEIYDSLRLGQDYEIFQGKSPEMWTNDREKYLKVRELAEMLNPNAFDDFIYDKLKMGREQSIFATLKNVSFDPEVPGTSKKAPRTMEEVAGTSKATSEENDRDRTHDITTNQLTPSEDQNYPDLNNIDAGSSSTPFVLYLKPDEEEPFNEPSPQEREKIIQEVEKEIGGVVREILAMKEEELPVKFQKIIQRVRQNVENSKKATYET